ncbi:single-stranded DNA-binding protein [Knoellia sinensis KCTC 19936]|uniref:Single-stranded DNA-binding protein n=1 Tax=Knoellia sinensis KCTC 19936 TaxID=1385520 RepID=A0A0A0JC77_9MICO|nr:single-stranded DNA-binding protein [Knoellia sinensis]KGN34783.1 single-stranded DNA-binding protein [Knoellia sinensis KCTC 19936]
MQDTNVTVHGRLVADPEVCVGKSGQPYAKFRIASTPRRPVSGQPGAYEDGETAFYNVYAFRNLGANVVKSFRRGEPIIVHGRLRVRDFQRDDKSYGTSVNIDANGAGHDLSWGQAAYEKVIKPSYGTGDRMDDAFGGEQVPEEPESFGNPETDPYLLAERPAEVSVGPLIEESAA